MFKEFTTALIQKILTFLSSHHDFFGQSKAEKENLSAHLSVPHAFKEYLISTNEKEFLADLKIAMIFIHQPKDKSIAKSDFFKALLKFLNTDLARKMDLLDSRYYLMEKPDREKVVNELIKGESLLADSLRNILVNYTYQQICENINSLSSIIADAPYIVVQSPREVTPEIKKEVRAELYEKYPLSFPVFQINKKLIGGLRIFENGTTNDHSWLSRVLKFTSLTSA